MGAASIAGARARAVGGACEVLALHRLAAYGVTVERIETGWRVRRQPGGRIVGAVPLRPVLADLVGVWRGRAVLCEVKATADEVDRLPWSRLDAHQVANLDRWQAAGAIVLVAWVRGARVLLIPWRAAPGWGPRHALPWATAEVLAWSSSQELRYE